MLVLDLHGCSCGTRTTDVIAAAVASFVACCILLICSWQLLEKEILWSIFLKHALKVVFRCDLSTKQEGSKPDILFLKFQLEFFFSSLPMVSAVAVDSGDLQLHIKNANILLL